MQEKVKNQCGVLYPNSLITPASEGNKSFTKETLKEDKTEPSNPKLDEEKRRKSDSLEYSLAKGTSLVVVFKGIAPQSVVCLQSAKW